MPDANHEDDQAIVLDPVEDPVLADANAPDVIVACGEVRTPASPI